MSSKKFISLSVIIITLIANNVHGNSIQKKGSQQTSNNYEQSLKKNIEFKNCPIMQTVDQRVSEIFKQISDSNRTIITVDDVKDVDKKIDEAIKKFYHNYQNTLIAKLENASTKNDECGVQSLNFLLRIIYSPLHFSGKEKQAKQRLLEFAKSKNKYAMVSLCSTPMPELISMQERIKYCQKIINSNIDDTEFIKDQAYSGLARIYFEQADSVNFIKLCENKKIHTFCFYMPIDFDIIELNVATPGLNHLADKFYKDKKYEQALYLYKKSAPFDQRGNLDLRIAYMYLTGLGTEKNFNDAISFYKKALNKSIDYDVKSEILNNIAFAYENLMNFVKAYNNYYQAALMGNILSQYNLALLYYNGHGVLKDNIQAYAWLSIAIAQGLKDKNSQSRAENLKQQLTYILQNEDSTGTTLKQAQGLARQYYKKYVLHDKLIPIADSGE